MLSVCRTSARSRVSPKSLRAQRVASPVTSTNGSHCRSRWLKRLHTGLSPSSAKAQSLFPRIRPQQPQVRHVSSGKDIKESSAEAEDSSSTPATSSEQDQTGTYSEADHEHAVISTFDLFSIGIGPSSSHTVGPMRAGNIFVADLVEAGLLSRVHKIHVSTYGSLALTGDGHMTPSALLLGLESADVETVDTAYVPVRFEQIKKEKRLFLGKGLPEGRVAGKEVDFDYEKDFRKRWGQKLPLHSNGMRLTVFDEEGTMLATNDLFSVGGGFVVNGAMSTAHNSATTSIGAEHGSDAVSADPTETDAGTGHPADLAENLFYKEIRRSDAAGDRKMGAEIKASDDDPALLGPSAMEMVSSSDTAIGSSSVGDIEDEHSEAASQQPSYPFRDARSLLALCNKHNLTIAQLVYENEKSHGYTDEEILEKLFRIWEVMDNSILEGVQAPTDALLPGSLKLHRRAPALYRRLTRGLYPSQAPRAEPEKGRNKQLPPLSNKETAGFTTTGPPSSEANASTSVAESATSTLSSRIQAIHKRDGLQRIHGSLYHPLLPSPSRRTNLPALDYLTVYAIAVNETNAAGGRIVTAPTNGAAGIIPAVLKYTLEFISDDPDRDIATFLLTAAAIGMLYKRGATISAAEGGCMAEVGVACSMAAGAFAACLGAAPAIVEQAAEIGIEHNLGLTCDPIAGLVQAPCIERNALGAVKAVASANLALQGSNSGAVPRVRLDDAIRAMRVTAAGMRNEFKETSLSGLATSVPLNIPVSVPDC